MSNIIKKGFYFLKKIFQKNNLMLAEAENTINEVPTTNTLNTLKKQNKINTLTNDIVNIIDNNQEALKYLNDEQLRFLNNYYKDDIKRLNNDLNDVKNEIKDINRLLDYYKALTA